MKLLFSLTYYHPYVSGLTIYVKRLAENLISRGHTAEIICFKHDASLADQENINNVNTNRIKPWLRFSKGFLSGEWIGKSWNLVKKSDVVIVNLPQAEGWITALCAKIQHKKVISIYLCEINMTNKVIQKILEIANILTMIMADRIVTYTKDYANSSKLLNLFKNKVGFVYPPIPRPTTNNAWKKKLEKDKNLKIFNATIGIAARMATEKGFEYLFEAIPELEAKLSKVVILVAGPTSPVGEKKYKLKIDNIVRRFKNKIIFLDNIPENKMGSFYELLDVLVLPSVNSTEAFGMVQAEAMMMGVPVVVSDLPGVRVPVVKTGGGKIVPLRNPVSLAKAIIDVVKKRRSYSKLKQTARREFDIKKVIDWWQTELNSLI